MIGICYIEVYVEVERNRSKDQNSFKLNSTGKTANIEEIEGTKLLCFRLIGPFLIDKLMGLSC